MSDFGMAPAAGTVRITHDGTGHSICMWTEAGQWEPLTGVRRAEVAVEAGKPAIVALTFDAVQIEALAEPGKALLEVFVNTWDPEG